MIKEVKFKERWDVPEKRNAEARFQANELIETFGMKISFLASHIDMNYSNFYMWLKGKKNFTYENVEKVEEVLKLFNELRRKGW